MAAGDRHQVGTIGEIGLVGPVQAGAPVRRVDEQGAGKRLADIALLDQVADIGDGRRHPPLQTHRMPHALAFGGFEHPCGFLGVPAERPFRIDVLAGVDGGHDGIEVVGHFHAHRYQIDILVLRQFHRIGERQRRAVVFGGSIGGFLARGADGHDLEFGQALQGRHMGDGGEASVGRDADHADTDLACHLDGFPSRRGFRWVKIGVYRRFDKA